MRRRQCLDTCESGRTLLGAALIQVRQTNTCEATEMGSNMGVNGRVYIQTKRNRSIEYLEKRMDVDTAR